MRQAPAVIRTGATGLTVPELAAKAGDEAAIRFVEFFTAHIRNPNTRAAYGRAALDFFARIGACGARHAGTALPCR